jgi:conjugal transfer/type IV secretion protein DotA/TraY
MTSMFGRADRALLGGVIALCLLMAALPALAQSAPTPMDTANMFGTNTGDAFSSVFLNQIFGPLFPSADGTNATTVFSEIIGYFNVIMLVVGGLMFFWNVTVGILQTAHEGSILGQRWSSLWAPLRVIFAVGLLVPLPNMGGYNLAQAGVAYIVKGSTNIASAVWSTAATMIIQGNISLAAAPAKIDAATVKIMFDNAACAAIANYRFAAAAGEGETPLQVQFLPHDDRSLLQRVGFFGENYTTTMMSQVVGGWGKREGICGSYTTPDLPDFIKKAIIAAEDDGVTLAGSNVEALVNKFQEAHVRSMDALFQNLYTPLITNQDNVLTGITDASAPLPDIREILVSAYEAANEELQTGIAEVMRISTGSSGAQITETSVRIPLEGEEFRQRMLDRITGGAACVNASAGQTTACYGEGWIGAGSWYMMMGRINNEIATITEASSSVKTSTYVAGLSQQDRNVYILSQRAAGGKNDSAVEDNLISSRFQEAFRQSTAGLAALGFSLSTGDLERLNEATTPDDILDSILGFDMDMFRLASFWVESTSPSNFSADPMMGLVSIGKLMISASGVMIAAGAVAGYSVSVLGNGGTIPAGIATMIQIPAMTLLAGGSTLTFVLPLTPFIFWVMAVSGFFLLVVEAIVAVNLWALGHMRMDGDGISGEGGRMGWLMMLSLLMTPVLMVFGFLIGMTIFRVTTALFDIGMNQALSGILGGGPFITLAAMLIYTVTTAVVYMLMIERSFSLVATFPGRVLKWMGAGSELDVDTNTARMGAAAGAAAGGALGKTGAQLGIRSGMKARSIVDNVRGRTLSGGEKGADTAEKKVSKTTSSSAPGASG